MLRLYTDYLSQPCRAIAILLRTSNIHVQDKIVTFVDGETRSDWFTKINPMKCVPVLEEDGFILTESLAIMKYLCTKPSVSGHWYPPANRQRALVDEYLSWQYTTGTRLQCGRVFITQALTPHRTGDSVNMGELRTHATALNTALTQMEKYFLGDKDFLAGDKMTLADLSAVCELMQAITVGYPAMKGRPRLTSWFCRVKEQLQPHFDDTHEDIIEFCGKYKRENWNST